MSRDKTTKKPARGQSIGGEMVRRLKRFTEELSRTNDLEARFNGRTIRLNLAPQSYNAELVRRTRATLRASQSVFARFLGVSISAVHDWEQGLKTPSGSACRLMDEIRRHPEYWLARLRELAAPADAK